MRCCIKCKVEMGTPYYPIEKEENRQNPPKNHHSIYGRAGTCELNYPECCVYTSDAILPVYVIVYSYDRY
jgi:hypothetical protein